MDLTTSATLVALINTRQEQNTLAKKLQAKAGDPAAPRQYAEVVELEGVAMTVPYKVIVDTSSSNTNKFSFTSQLLTEEDRQEMRIEVVAKIVREAFTYVEAKFSPYAKHSELYKLNHSTSEWTEVSAEFVEVMDRAGHLNKISEGLFDPTAAKFGEWYTAQVEKAIATGTGATLPEARALVEADPECQKRRSLVGWETVVSLKKTEGGVQWSQADPDTRGDKPNSFYVRKSSPDVHVDLCGLSKGWCVDYLVKCIQKSLFPSTSTTSGPPGGGTTPLPSVFVDWGGDSRCIGLDPHSHKRWVNKVLRPARTSEKEKDVGGGGGGTSSHAAHLKMPKTGAAVCTSGDYFQRSVATGYTHITHPASGLPLHVDDPTRVTSCTVITESRCDYADALATVLMLLRKSEISSWVNNFNSNTQEEDNQKESPTPRILRYVTIDRSGEVFDTQNTLTHKKVRKGEQQEATVAASLCQNISPTHSGSSELGAIRTILGAAPRVVHVLLLGNISVPTSPTSSSFACTLTSVLQLPPPKKVTTTTGEDGGQQLHHSALFYLMADGFAAQYLNKKRGEKGAATAATVELFCLPEGTEAEQLATELGEGKFSSADDTSTLSNRLKRVCAPTGWLVAASGDDGETAVVGCQGEVGDHLLVTLKGNLFLQDPHGEGVTHLSLHDAAQRKVSELPRVLLRGGRSFLPPSSKKRSNQYSKLAVVATCSNPSRSSGGSFAGVTLGGLELASRDPPLLTAVVPDHKLSRSLFLPSSTTPAADSGSGGQLPWVTHIRLHCVTDDSRGRGLIDWFNDGSTTDGGTQFMYFAPPPSVGKLATASSSSTSFSTAPVSSSSNKSRTVLLKCGDSGGSSGEDIPDDETPEGDQNKTKYATHRTLVVPYNFEDSSDSGRTIDACLVSCRPIASVNPHLLVIMRPLGSQLDLASSKLGADTSTFPLL